VERVKIEGRTATIGNRAARGQERWQVQLLPDSRAADQEGAATCDASLQ